MSRKFLTPISLPADPTLALEAATKQYVDSKAGGGGSGQWKDPVRLSTTANITLSGFPACDGGTPVAGDRVLVKAQTTSSQNGIYVAAAGAWTRSTDADTGAKLLSAAVVIREGLTCGDTAWLNGADAPITVDATPIYFLPISINEVAIATSDPFLASTTTELWYNPDATSSAMDTDVRWYTAWGAVASVTKSTSSPTVSSGTYIDTGISVTFSQVAGRRYTITFEGLSVISAVGVSFNAVITDAANTGVHTISTQPGTANQGNQIMMVAVVDAATTATVTYKVRISVNTGSGYIYADTSALMRMIVQDAGPSVGSVPVMPPSFDARWNTAWGIIAIAAPYGAGIPIPASTVTRITSVLPVFLQSGRRYRVVYNGRAISAAAASTMQFTLYDNGANSGGIDYWHMVPTGNYDDVHVEVLLAGDGNIHNYDLRAGGNAGALGIYSDLGGHAFYVEDVGPVTAAVFATNPGPPWFNATLLNGWNNLGAPWAITQYRRVGDIVYIRGHVNNATAPPATAAQAIFTLPPGYRPAAYEIFGQNCGGTPPGYGDAIVRIQVMSDTGNVEVLRANTTGQNPQSYTSLTNMQFSVI